jgi:O-antigen/teichoic acid export membrane protein
LIRRWIRLLSEYTAAQAVTQLLGVAAGLLIVNLLPVREYALYTFALSVFTFLTVFSDLGVSSALLYFRRGTRAGQAPFTPYIRAALRLRHALLVVGAIGGLSFMAIIAPERGFSAAEIAAVGALMVAAAWSQIGASLNLLLLRLEGNYRESYVAEALGNAVRLLAVAGMWITGAATAWLAMSTGAVGALVTKFAASRKPAQSAEPPAAHATQGKSNPVRGIIGYVLPTSLGAAYFSIQAPLVVWLSAFFAGTESVAEVGALGRLGLIFGLLSGFVGAVLLPRLSAITDDALYRRRYFETWAVLAGFGLAVIVIGYAFPDWLLLLLGHAYRGLDDEVLVIAANSVLGTWVGYCVGINNSRGWVRHQPGVLAAYASIQVALVFALDLSTTLGILHFALCSSLAALTLQLVVNAVGFVRPRWVELKQP